MEIKKLTYLHFALLAALLLSACKVEEPKDTLSGNGEKTPISVTALLDAGGAAQTRAADKDFASGDQLLAYVRHVTWNGGFTSAEADKRTVVNADQAPRLVTFTCTGSETWDNSMPDIFPFGSETIAITGQGAHPDTKQATGLAASYTNTAGETVNALYWDDFSENDANDGQAESKNLRDEGHYLQSYYGYCYNGSPAFGESGTHITSALAEATGVLGWQVATDQSAANTGDPDAFKHSDLLWSAEQTPIAYAHVDGQGNRNHGTLVLPYTHAMSKVTINVTLHKSFGDGADFSRVTTTLHEMFTHCTCTAPTYTLTNKGTAAVDQTTDIIMWNGNTTDGKTTTCTFEAIVVPSILTSVNNFATITGLDGNKYIIPITEAMLQVADNNNDNKGWGAQLIETAEHINNGIAQAPAAGPINRGKGYEMKSGVNYVLNVTISKQQITVSATIRDWVNVEAEGKAIIEFNPNVDGTGDIAEGLRTIGFDVYKNSVNTDFDTKTTTLTWNSTYSKWTYNPIIYWAGQQDASYFRALAPKDRTTAMTQDKDILWGYACDDDANNRNKVGTTDEVAITPRTGDVPLHFEHPMSKISVTLKTPEGDYNDATCPAVNLTGAQIKISNLATSGTLSMADGSITPDETTSDAIPSTTSITDKFVIPQTIYDNAILTITLSDNTVYKLQLNTCEDSNSSADPKPAITEWERGKHYTYTINVEKEAITFRAMIKDWEERKGSGNATLEWD